MTLTTWGERGDQKHALYRLLSVLPFSSYVPSSALIRFIIFLSHMSSHFLFPSYVCSPVLFKCVFFCIFYPFMRALLYMRTLSYAPSSKHMNVFYPVIMSLFHISSCRAG